MNYENDIDTDVQKVDLFTFFPTIILPDDKNSLDRKKKLSEKKRSSIQNKKEVVHKLIRYFKNV